MLTMAIKTEVEEYLSEHCRQLDQNGHRLVVRNGYLTQLPFPPSIYKRGPLSVLSGPVS